MEKQPHRAVSPQAEIRVVCEDAKPCGCEYFLNELY
jgi:hypothetical protein